MHLGGTAAPGAARTPKDAAKVNHEDLARWTKKYQKHNVLVQGSIRYVKYNGNNVSLTLDFAGFIGGIIYWRQPDDFPNLLEQDWVDVWGEFVEMKTSDVDGLPVAIIHVQQIKLNPELGQQPVR
jgi:hypothetical protein